MCKLDTNSTTTKRPPYGDLTTHRFHAAHVSVARQRFGEHYDVVIISEPSLHQVQRSDIATHPGVSLPNQPQRVPQSLDRFTPLMEVLGSLVLLRALHRFPPASMRGADAPGQRAGIAVGRPPILRDSMNELQLSFDILPSRAFDLFRSVPFSIDKLVADLSERRSTEQQPFETDSFDRS